MVVWIRVVVLVHMRRFPSRRKKETRNKERNSRFLGHPSRVSDWDSLGWGSWEVTGGADAASSRQHWEYQVRAMGLRMKSKVGGKEHFPRD